MAADSVWVKTHEALNDFMKILACKKCHKKFSNPKQYLNCGHFACAECIGSNSNCVVCGIPGETCQIRSDSSLNELLINLNVISEAIGFDKSSSFNIPKSNIICDSDNLSLISSIRASQKSNVKTLNKKLSIDETLNSSIGESTFSKSSNSVKANKNIPKNLNKKNRKGETALHTACQANKIERVKVLLEAGANTNTKDNAGWTPLQESANYGFYEVCELLLNAGALPDVPGYENRTALHEAARIDDCDLAALLINFKANRNVFDNVGKKPKDYCKSQKMAQLFQTLQNTTDNESTLHCEQKNRDLDRSLNQTLIDNKIVLYGSNLKPKNRKILAFLGSDKKLKIVNSFGVAVTHAIFETDSTNNINLSYDVLLCIIHGKWLLNSDCLSVLRESNNIEANDLEIFELNPRQLDDGPFRARTNLEKQNPGLFDNCHFYFDIRSYEPISYDKIIITKEQLAKLATAGGGIVLTREPKPEDALDSLIPFHVANKSNHSLHKCTHYIIYVPENSSSMTQKIRYNMLKLKTLPLMWFIESILRFQLIDPIDLGIPC